MKKLLLLACTWFLCSCSSAPVMTTSINGYDYSSGPTSFDDPRARHAQFYMDEGDSMPWLKAVPQNNR